MKTHHPVRGMRKQRGLVAVIVTIALFAFLGIAALAIDINHALMNRTKLQSSVDSAALAAAVILDSSGSDASAKAVAKDSLAKMAAASGNGEFDFDSASIAISFSNDPTDFSGSYDDTADDRYVRVAVSNLSLNSYFIQLLGVNKTLSASAVAGRSASATDVCNVVPMGICALDPDETDPLLAGGYSTNNVYSVKMVSNESDMGPGNFQLLDLDGTDDDSEDKNTKEDHIKYQLAGAYESCISIGGDVTTKPGNTIGPTSQGLNTRFDGSINGKVKFSSPDDDITEAVLTSDQVQSISDTYPESTVSADDLVDKSGQEFNYGVYDSTLTSEDGTVVKQRGNNRRVLAVPILDCSGSGNGKTTFPVVSVGCFFLLQKVASGNSDKSPVYGEFIKECVSDNISNNGVSSSEGPYRIVLYDDPDNEES